MQVILSKRNWNIIKKAADKIQESNRFEPYSLFPSYADLTIPQKNNYWGEYFYGTI